MKARRAETYGRSATTQITLTLMFSLDYQRVLGREGDVGIVVYQVMMLVAPHLQADRKSVV